MKILFGALLSVLILVGVGLILIYSGAYNVAATSEDGPLLRWVLNTTQERSIHARASDDEIAVRVDSATMQRGFRAYETMCVVCHGAPGVDRGWMGQGMYPLPPDLSDEAEEFTASELYWILSNGIKMAGMPALSPSHSEAEILELVSFVEHLPQVSAEDYQQLRDAQLQSTSTVASADDGHTGHTH